MPRIALQSLVQPVAAALMLCLVPAAVAQDEAPAVDAADAPENESLLAKPQSFWTDWTGKVDLGLNGAEGNTNRFAFRGALKMERKTEKMETTFDAWYTYAQDNRVESQNQGILFGRNDWLMSDSKWRWYLQAAAEYDNFQSWDWRLSTSTGPGYDFISTDKTTLTGRAGLGFSQTIAGDPGSDEFRPEGLAGIDWTQQLTQKQKLTAFATYLPALDDFPDRYRVNLGAEWVITVDEENGLTLTLGVLDRYDSKPGVDTKRNQLDYYVTLGWTF